MARISTNAGKHPYMRSDSGHLFGNLEPEKAGIPFNADIKIRFVNVVDTEYRDERDKIIYFKNIVKYNGETYQVDYDGQNFWWIIRSEENPTKTHKLSAVAKSLTLNIRELSVA